MTHDPTDRDAPPVPDPRGGEPGPRGGSGPAPGRGGGPPEPPGGGSGGPSRLRLLRHPMVWRVTALFAVAVAVWWFTAEGREAPLPLVDDEAGEPAPTWADADWDVFSAKVNRGLEEGWDTLPVGPAMARLGRTFVGAAYVPGTLDPPGPEGVVVNFRELDCVTFVETVFATVRFLRLPDAAALLHDRGAAEERYESLLAELRYREGVVDGYASRLHYFSEWIAANAGRGLVRPLARELQGEADTTAIDFMTTHPDAYRQLADTSNRAAVRATEGRLSARPRWYVPEGRIPAVADRIREGDVIAATSTVAGLDVAHTGLAVREGGILRLLHAPLVGEAVEISERSLAERIRAIEGQDGIMVARPLPAGEG